MLEPSSLAASTRSPVSAVPLYLPSDTVAENRYLEIWYDLVSPVVVSRT